MTTLREVQSNYGKLDFYIDGEWVESKSEQIQPAMNPAKDEIIAKVPFALSEEIEKSVEAAANAFEKWRNLPLTTRVRYMFAMKSKLEEHFEEMARVTTQNHGKIIDESRGEMRRLIENVESACSAMYTLAKGEHVDQVATDINQILVREPLGVFAILGPFNFPTLAPFWFIPYALALGCTLVVKPSEICPVPMHWTYKALEDVELPRGVLNLVHGGREVSEALIAHPEIEGVAFVGSTPVAKQVYKLVGEHGKRAIAQGGAKNYVAIMPDVDLDKAIPALMSSFYGNTGQRCLSGANLVAVGDVYETLKKKFVEASSKLRLGYGLDESAEVGPVVTSKARQRVESYIGKGSKEGAKLVLDGRNPKVKDYSRGYFIAPTIFDNVTPDMTIAKDEIFGPVSCILRAVNLDEVLDMINKKTDYGNAACIFTSSGKAANDFRQRVKAGNIGVNIGVPAPMGFFPFCGRRESFFGTLHGQMDCVDFFTDKKVTVERW